ncbi:RRM domain-containing protein [Mycena indigotica]|uniref:RRM domain-containing protein n=1 Tax=Mycena indigotica TaxID=2126181 RepID=A0A8H6SXE9_9AGAR|nr:RRM domain-containing protein [Mycena indigotica]KAF7307129.1 RRM domain-containing protein [Mycena indigotica]
MSAPQKLTKKQKKSLAFYRKGKSQDGPSGVADLEGDSVPVLEVQDQADDGLDSPALVVEAESDSAKRLATRKGKGKADDTGIVQATITPEKKRKRDSITVPQDAEPKRKKAKQTADATERSGKADERNEGKVKQRYILFAISSILPPQKPLKTISQHVILRQPSDYELPKPSTSSKPTIKSKGCAFVEFTHRNALQQGLKLHQSELEGRRINVELTVGGGGKSDARIQKLKERNKTLHGQRKEQLEKLAKADPTLAVAPERPQRFSATSGLEQTPLKRRTWTVGDVEDGETHRGGKKHSKARRKQWGTGVNAIPVG